MFFYYSEGFSTSGSARMNACGCFACAVCRVVALRRLREQVFVFANPVWLGFMSVIYDVYVNDIKVLYSCKYG